MDYLFWGDQELVLRIAEISAFHFSAALPIHPAGWVAFYSPIPDPTKVAEQEGEKTEF